MTTAICLPSRIALLNGSLGPLVCIRSDYLGTVGLSSEGMSRNKWSKSLRSNEFAICDSHISSHRHVIMYGVLQYQARPIFLSICHEALLVHYIFHDF